MTARQLAVMNAVRSSSSISVPYSVVRLIHRLVEARERGGRHGPTLQAVAIGDFDRFDRLLSTA